MADLVLILTDFYGAPAANSAPPRLPQLEWLLARATRQQGTVHWRQWLGRRWPPPLPHATLAATIAAAWQVPLLSSRRSWLATPVHYVVGLDGIALDAGGPLRLSDEEQAQLVMDFTRVFGDPWQLTALGQRELLLTGPAASADGADPTEYTGSDPTPGLPRGAEAPALRRLGSELELWLHEHPVNQARQRRALTPVSTLWMWGGMPLPASLAGAPPAARPLTVWGLDTYVEALRRLRAAAVTDVPAQFDAAAMSQDAVLLWPLQADGLLAGLQRCERDWIAPALQALRRGRLAGLQLLFAHGSYRLSGWQRLRFWRQPRAWWLELQCP